MGIKKVVAAVKAANPAWSVGSKEVRAATATADDKQQTEIERLMRLQLGLVGGV